MTVVEGHLGQSAGSGGTASRRRGSKEQAIRRRVVVVMPFGGEEAERRRAILNFKRLKYIIEKKCRVVPKVPYPSGARVGFDVGVARTAMDSIPDVALDKIDKADILVALLSERNVNVAYELGFRRARKGKVVLVSNSKADLPIYEAGVAFQSWKEDVVLGEIDRIVSAEFPRLDDFEVDIPDALQQAIDAEDGPLIDSLQLALQEVENEFVPAEPDPVQKLRGVLSGDILRFYPSSIVEVRFAQRGEYENPECPATVVDFDDAFCVLYGYAGKNVAQLDRPLSIGVLSNRISKFSDPGPWKKFMDEQTRLTETVIKGYGPARATVPIKFNDSHPDSGFAGRSFLPCMAAQVIDGDLDGPHKMYLLIAYIELDHRARSVQ